MSTRPGIVFIDVDHTILRRSSGRDFLVLGVKLGIFPAKSLLYIPGIYLRYRLGSFDTDLGRWLFPILKGKSRESLLELSMKSFPKMKRDLYPAAVTLIGELKKAERQVVFATSSLDIIVRPLAEYLGVDDVVASRLEFDRGISTGRFVEAPLFKQHKKLKVLEFLRNSNARPEECAFYTDSFQDLPLLEAVGEPVAVNPDWRLKKIAQERGWRILWF